jgi:hypothetical protein
MSRCNSLLMGELDDEEPSRDTFDGGYSIGLYVCELFSDSSCQGNDLYQLYGLIDCQLI